MNIYDNITSKKVKTYLFIPYYFKDSIRASFLVALVQWSIMMHSRVCCVYA